MKTTLVQIRKHSPCRDGWEKLLKYLGKMSADEEPLDLLTVLESNGLPDTLWCLRVSEEGQAIAQRFALRCAQEVEYLASQASRNALAVVARFLEGQASREELRRARKAAYAAAAYAADAAVYWTAYASAAAAASASAAYAADAADAPSYASAAAAASASAAYAADADAAAARQSMRQRQTELLKELLA